MIGMLVLVGCVEPAPAPDAKDRSATTTLSLFMNELEAITQPLATYPNLRRLSLILGDSDRTLPPVIQEFQQIETLEILGQDAPCSLVALRQLKQLRVLSTHSVRSSDILLDAATLPLLRELHVIDAQLETLPEALARLDQLETLDLGYNQLKTKADLAPLLSLPQLKALRLDHNPLQQFPAPLLAHPNLRLLLLRVCGLEKGGMEAVPGAENSPLEALYLEANALSQLPLSITQLPQLKQLNLSYNQLKQLPDTLAASAVLQTLDLCENQLNQLPAAWLQGKNLRTLRLQHNQLQTLPSALGQHKTLIHLQLYENQFKRLPLCVGQLEGLEQLDLRRNPLDTVPQWLGALSALDEVVVEPEMIVLGDILYHTEGGFINPFYPEFLQSYSSLEDSPLYRHHSFTKIGN